MSYTTQLFPTAVAGEQHDDTLLPLPCRTGIPLIVSNRHGHEKVVITMMRRNVALTYARIINFLNPGIYHRTPP